MNYNKSVNCYLCGLLKDEKDCIHADQFNNNDGGSICEKCLTELDNKDDITEGEPNNDN